MTSFSQTSLLRFLFAGLLWVFSVNHAASDEEEISFAHHPPSPALPTQGTLSPSVEGEDHHSSGTRSPSPLRRKTPQELANIVVGSCALTQPIHIAPIIYRAARLQRTLSDDIVAQIMQLGGRYFWEHSHPLLVSQFTALLKALGKIEKSFPTASLFAYNSMITQYENDSLPTWTEENQYLWLSAESFHRAQGDERLATDMLKWASHFTYPQHTYEQKHHITTLIQEIILCAPQGYGFLFNSLLPSISGNRYESGDIIPFLEGFLTGLFHRPLPPAASPPPPSEEHVSPPEEEEGLPLDGEQNALLPLEPTDFDE